MEARADAAAPQGDHMMDEESVRLLASLIEGFERMEARLDRMEARLLRRYGDLGRRRRKGIKAGMARAKAEGKRIGRPKAELVAGELSRMRAVGLSLRAIGRAVTKSLFWRRNDAADLKDLGIAA
jgi:hypothetical protein